MTTKNRVNITYMLSSFSTCTGQYCEREIFLIFVVGSLGRHTAFMLSANISPLLVRVCVLCASVGMCVCMYCTKREWNTTCIHITHVSCSYCSLWVPRAWAHSYAEENGIVLGLNSISTHIHHIQTHSLAHTHTQAHAINPWFPFVQYTNSRRCVSVISRYVCVHVQRALAGEYLFDELTKSSISRWLFFHGITSVVTCLALSLLSHEEYLHFLSHIVVHSIVNILRFWKY